jgi:hypothetical protein
VTEASPLQAAKAASPMLVTLLGIVMEVSPLQAKASFPILVTLLGMTVFMHPKISSLVAVMTMALQLPRESKMAFPASTSKKVRPLQPLKARVPMLVKLLGISTEIKLLQPAKA